MSSRKQPCPKCGCVVIGLNSRHLYSHLRYCKEIEENNHNNDDTGNVESSVKIANPYACTERGVLESTFNTELDSLEFNIGNDEGWELNENSGLSECGSSEGSVEDDEAKFTNSKK